MKIHKKKITENQTNYYFTRSRTHCLMVQYDKTEDYGIYSTSSADFKISIHHNNSFVKKELTEIDIKEVPKAVVSALSYLNRA